MGAGDATNIYEGIYDATSITSAINTAANGVAGEQFVVVNNSNNKTVLIVHIAQA